MTDMKVELIVKKFDKTIQVVTPSGSETRNFGTTLSVRVEYSTEAELDAISSLVFEKAKELTLLDIRNSEGKS